MNNTYFVTYSLKFNENHDNKLIFIKEKIYPRNFRCRCIIDERAVIKSSNVNQPGVINDLI